MNRIPSGTPGIFAERDIARRPLSYYITPMGPHVSLANRSRRLRWRMTLSYSAVTLGALLTVELLLIGVVAILYTVILNSGSLQAQFFELASEQYAPELRPLLAQSPPDQQGIAGWLDRITAVSSADLPYSIDATDRVLVIGPDGRLWGVKPADLLGDEPIGRRFDPAIVTGLAEPLQAALSGAKETERLYTMVREEDKIALTVPVWDENEEQVLGVLILVGDLPSLADTLGDLAVIFAISLLLFTIIAALAGTLYGYFAARGPVNRLNRLSEATRAWSQGDFAVSVDDPIDDELGQLAGRLNDMARQLERLLESRRELGVMKERDRLARDLHDSVKQQAFAAAVQMSVARSQVTRDPAAAEQHIEEAERLTHALRQELTGLIQDMRPAALEGKGLAAALRDYAADWSRGNGIEAVVRVRGERSAPLDVEGMVFRIAGEALANVARHSGAGKVDIELAYGQEGLRLVIADDGVGFDGQPTQNGFGLRSMGERAAVLGGTLEVESGPGQGTRVSLSLPLAELNKKD